jgi:hypothetical protein
MLNLDKLKNIEEDNHKLYQKLLIQLSQHSDSNPNLLNIVEKISIQMNNMTEIINFLLEKENKNG